MREPDFELSADMRLLELQRGALGLPPRERLSWESHAITEGSLPVAQAEPEPGRTPVLSVEATAFPADGVIPGAVVTLTLSVANEGAAAATDIVVTVPLPGGAAYRPGSFVWNGRSTYDEVAETFFTAGLPIGTLAAGDRATFQWKIGVKLGTKPIVVAPQVRGSGTAVVGARPVVVGRKDQTTTAFARDVAHAEAAIYEPKPLIPVDIPATDLPIYELDEEEELVYAATDAALSAAAPPKFEEPQIAVPEPEPVAPEPAAEAVREAVVLYGSFDRATLAFFERIFLGTKPPGILQHCIFGGALACTLDAQGKDPASLKRHLDGQSNILHRIGLHERLGKKEPISEYAGELLAELDRLQPIPIVAPGWAQKGTLTLVSELSEPTRVVVANLAQERGRWDFVKARQLTLALQAQTVAGNLEPGLRSQIEAALQAYAQASVTTLQKLFVRIRIDRTTGLLFQNEPSLDAAAKAAVAALAAALGSP
ncbi:MAG TPA: hypothetical protein VFE36_04895 [Candidatus Baltobacteraceae bacterium]|nr:hypothetical protein [Candidatus Baltobacteraceae bacterium]